MCPGGRPLGRGDENPQEIAAGGSGIRTKQLPAGPLPSKIEDQRQVQALGSEEA